MEHIIVTKTINNLFRLVPEEGYILFDQRTKHTHASAIVSVRNLKFFSAIEEQ